MTPKLYGIAGSPPYGAVLMCAKVLGIELEIVRVDLLNGEHLKEGFVKLNPQHTIPLLDDDGFILADSHAIMGYLVGKYGKKNDPLYPKDDIKRRATIDHRFHLDSSILTARGFLITKPLALQGIKPDQKYLDLLKEGFSFLDKLLELQNTKYAVGNELSIADFSIITTATCWKFFVKDFDQDFPNIVAYIDRLKKEDFFDANAEGLERFNTIFLAKLNS
ncbi:glutathione S-transferase 1-like [Sitophilus oryzae]|uniref:Glutathione S-transferase 1-like n=1 Tax=Sitophilus oryzae TaxID=7048 RepID=A0A2S0BZ41_SITOR|nr:glutathione S-transferase 1-like [Sitophilus oryzae]ANS53394.1 glutathione-S-transferase epsilon class 6 [Sitophilus oryzae]